MSTFTSIARPMNLEAMGIAKQVETPIGAQCIDLQKGAISESFDSSSFSSNVIGSVVKRALESTKGNITKRLESLKKDYESKLVECKEKCGEPSSEIESWAARGLDIQTQFPKIYDLNALRKQQTSMQSIEEDCCYQYNRCVMNYVNVLVDQMTVDAMLVGIDENRTYYMSPRQMTLIGIK